MKIAVRVQNKSSLHLMWNVHSWLLLYWVEIKIPIVLGLRAWKLLLIEIELWKKKTQKVYGQCIFYGMSTTVSVHSNTIINNN